MKKSMNKKQGIDPFYGKINWASVSQHALIIENQSCSESHGKQSAFCLLKSQMLILLMDLWSHKPPQQLARFVYRGFFPIERTKLLNKIKFDSFDHESRPKRS